MASEEDLAGEELPDNGQRSSAARNEGPSASHDKEIHRKPFAQLMQQMDPREPFATRQYAAHALAQMLVRDVRQDSPEFQLGLDYFRENDPSPALVDLGKHAENTDDVITLQLVCSCITNLAARDGTLTGGSEIGGLIARCLASSDETRGNGGPQRIALRHYALAAAFNLCAQTDVLAELASHQLGPLLLACAKDTSDPSARKHAKGVVNNLRRYVAQRRSEKDKEKKMKTPKKADQAKSKASLASRGSKDSGGAAEASPTGKGEAKGEASPSGRRARKAKEKEKKGVVVESTEMDQLVTAESRGSPSTKTGGQKSLAGEFDRAQGEAEKSVERKPNSDWTPSAALSADLESEDETEVVSGPSSTSQSRATSSHSQRAPRAANSTAAAQREANCAACADSTAASGRGMGPSVNEGPHSSLRPQGGASVRGAHGDSGAEAMPTRLSEAALANSGARGGGAGMRKVEPQPDVIEVRSVSDEEEPWAKEHADVDAFLAEMEASLRGEGDYAAADYSVGDYAADDYSSAPLRSRAADVAGSLHDTRGKGSERLLAEEEEYLRAEEDAVLAEVDSAGMGVGEEDFEVAGQDAVGGSRGFARYSRPFDERELGGADDIDALLHQVDTGFVDGDGFNDGFIGEPEEVSSAAEPVPQSPSSPEQPAKPPTPSSKPSQGRGPRSAIDETAADIEADIEWLLQAENLDMGEASSPAGGIESRSPLGSEGRATGSRDRGLEGGVGVRAASIESSRSGTRSSYKATVDAYALDALSLGLPPSVPTSSGRRSDGLNDDSLRRQFTASNIEISPPRLSQPSSNYDGSGGASPFYDSNAVPFYEASPTNYEASVPPPWKMEASLRSSSHTPASPASGWRSQTAIEDTLRPSGGADEYDAYSGATRLGSWDSLSPHTGTLSRWGSSAGLSSGIERDGWRPSLSGSPMGKSSYSLGGGLDVDQGDSNDIYEFGGQSLRPEPRMGARMALTRPSSSRGSQNFY